MFVLMIGSDYPFDVFLSHASEDKPALRRLARQLEAAGFKVWLDEEQLNAGQEPQRALPEALKACRHILIWITEPWLAKDYTQWELKLFHGISDPERRVVPVLLVPWDDTTLGPYLTRKVAVELGLSEPERLWRIVCGLRGTPTGPREVWADRGQAFIETVWINFEPCSRADLDGRVGLRLDLELHQRVQAGDPVLGSNIELPVMFSERAESAGPVIAAGFDDRMIWLCIDIGGGPRGSTEAAFLVYDSAGWLLATWETRLRNDEGEVAELIREIRGGSGELFGLRYTIPQTGTGVDYFDFVVTALPSRDAEGYWQPPKTVYSELERGNIGRWFAGSLMDDLFPGPSDDIAGESDYLEVSINHRVEAREGRLLLFRSGYLRMSDSSIAAARGETWPINAVLVWNDKTREFIWYC